MRNASPRRLRPAAEALEERGLLSSSTLPWPDPGHLTLSITPDGSAVSGSACALSRVLGTAGTPAYAASLTAVLKAFQSWAVLTPINVGLVPDAGAPAGQAGPPERRPGQGDLRLAARPLDPSTLALSLPYDPYSAWSGEVVLNSDARFGDGSSGSFNLYDAALHEAGRVLGLPDSADPASAMSAAAVSGRAGLSASDVAAVQALYGARRPDAADAAGGNDSPWTASPLPCLGNAADLAAPGAAVEADLSTASDLDTYAVNAPRDGGAFAVVLRASGLSLLTPSVTVLDALGQPVVSASTADPLANDLTVTVPAGLPSAAYYVRVGGARADVFGIGSYRVAAGAPDLARTAAAATPAPVVGAAGLPDFAAKAAPLATQPSGCGSGWSGLAQGQLAGAGDDTDTFRVRTDASPAPVLVASVWSANPGGLTPRVDVFDAAGNPVASQLLYHDAGTYTVQVPRAAPSTWYVVRVAPLDSSSPAHASGRYLLEVDQRASALPLVPLVSGTLDGARTQDFYGLTVASGRVFHFDLSDRTGNTAQGAAVLTVYDAQKQAVVSLRAPAGAPPATADVTLAPGRYLLRVASETRWGAPTPLLYYALRTLTRPCGAGPTPVDTSLYPVGPTPTSAPVDPYAIVKADPSEVAWLANPLDPFSNAWLY